MSLPIITRKEQYLAYLSGDKTVTLPEPITNEEHYLYYLCTHGGTGGGGVTSWNDLEDKPFYDEKAEIFHQTVDCTTDLGGVYGAVFETSPFVISDKTYIVTWNGTEYYCVAREPVAGMGYFIGNVGLLGATMTDEPFLIGHEDEGLLVVAIESGDYDVKIEETITVKIPDRYVPNVTGLVVVQAQIDERKNVYVDMPVEEIVERTNRGEIVVCRAIYAIGDSIMLMMFDNQTQEFEEYKLIPTTSALTILHRRLGNNGSDSWFYSETRYNYAHTT